MTGVNPSGQRSDGETAPFHGEVVTLRFDGREVAVWWGPDGDLDRLAAAEGGFSLAVGGRLRGATCGGRGCTGLGAEDGDETVSRSMLNFEPAQAWLRGQRATLDASSALNLGNFQWDVEATTTGGWRPLGRMELRCHEKLTVANVPWRAGEEAASPLSDPGTALDAARLVLGTPTPSFGRQEVPCG